MESRHAEGQTDKQGLYQRKRSGKEAQPHDSSTKFSRLDNFKPRWALHVIHRVSHFSTGPSAIPDRSVRLHRTPKHGSLQGYLQFYCCSEMKTISMIKTQMSNVVNCPFSRGLAWSAWKLTTETPGWAIDFQAKHAIAP